MADRLLPLAAIHEYLAAMAPYQVAPALPAEAIAAFEAVAAITAQMFPGDVVAEVESDPDDSGPPFVVFNVTAKGSPDELVERRLRWRRRIREVKYEPFDLFRITIYPG